VATERVVMRDIPLSMIQPCLYDCIMIDPVSALSALAQEDRLSAFRLLVKQGPSGLPSGEIAELLAIAPSRMSFHLATLERAGLLTSWRAGRRIFYAASYQTMRQLLAFLVADCCDGQPEICGDLTRLAAACEPEPTE